MAESDKQRKIKKVLMIVLIILAIINIGLIIYVFLFASNVFLPLIIQLFYFKDNSMR